MIKRKIDVFLNTFFKDNHKALLVTGARQIGKTYSVREAAKRNFENFIEINFITSPEAVGIFPALLGGGWYATSCADLS